MDELPRHTLMIPGPAELEPEVLAETRKQTAAHYGREWATMYLDTASLLKQVFQTGGDVLLLFCSGSGGMEAAINSAFVAGDRVVAIENGFFGERMRTIASSLGLEVIVVPGTAGRPIRAEDVAQVISSNENVRGLLAVHHETSTGVLNPIAELGELARAHDVTLIVDAVSSLGGEPLHMDAWGVDICVSAANKCLGGPVGIAPVAVSSRAWERMAERPNFSRGWYLNLEVWRHYASAWGKAHPHPVTMSSQSVTGLRAAVKALLGEGLEARWQRYHETALRFRSAMRRRGYEMFVEGEAASSVITAVKAKPGMDVDAFVEYLKSEHAIHVGGGIGPTGGKIFRVGHMGPAGSPETIEAFLAAVDAYDAL